MKSEQVITFEHKGEQISLACYEGDYITKIISNARSFYEMDVLNFISLLPVRDGVFLDVGANVGNHTIYFSRIMGRKVHAFEIIPQSRNILISNIERNKVSSDVTVHDVGLFSEKGEVVVAITDDNMGACRIVESEDKPKDETVLKQPVSTLDNIIPDAEDVAFIKLDVEGSEYEVLRGARSTIERCRPICIVEANDTLSGRRLLELMAELRYSPICIVGQSDNWVYVPEEVVSIFGPIAELFKNRFIERSEKSANARLTATLKEQIAMFERSFDIEIDRLRKLNQTTMTRNARLKEQNTTLDEKNSKYAMRIANLHRHAQISERSATNWEGYARSLFTTKGFKFQRALVLIASKLGAPISIRSFQDVRSSIKAKAAALPRVSIEDGVKLTHQTGPVEQTAQPLGSTGISSEFLDSFPQAGKFRAQPDGQVRVGIASIPSREEALQQTISSLLPQVDQIFVALNSYERMPEFLDHEKVVAVCQENFGDRAKFQFLQDFVGYYFCCDDDIIYPDYYVDQCITGIENYKRTCAVGWHGSIIEPGFESYYDNNSRSVYTFGSRNATDRFVHVLGTGILAFHTDTIAPAIEDFPEPSMADIFFARKAWNSRVPLVQLKHPAKAAIAFSLPEDTSISDASIANTETPLNVRDKATQLIQSSLPLHSPMEFAPIFARGLRVALIGRTSADRWMKGGVYKSCRLLGKQIELCGGNVTYLEIEAPIDENRKALRGRFDVVIFYTGDQDAQDYFPVEQLIDYCTKLGHVVLANLSYNLEPSRTNVIAQIMSRDTTNKLHLMAFSDDVRRDPLLADHAKRIVTIPKAIELVVRSSDFSYADREGIFIGELGKLATPYLTPNLGEVLQVIHDAVPGVPLFAVNAHFGSKTKPELLADVEVMPYGDPRMLFTRPRIYLHCHRFCTFEMMPVEAMASGLPVVYVDMPQSLNRYIGSCGLAYSSMKELMVNLELLYYNASIWSAISASGKQQGSSIAFEKSAGAVTAALVQMISECNQHYKAYPSV